MAAARAGDFEALLEVLDPEVTIRVHAAPGDPRTAALSNVGAENVAEQVITQGRSFVQIARPAMVNGSPGMVTERDGKIIGATECTISGGRITTMDLVLDPDRLSRSDD